MKVFRHDDADPSSLTDDYIQNIFDGPDEKLYINTPAGGINIYDPITEKFLSNTNEYLQNKGILRYGLVKVLITKHHVCYFVYRDSGIYRVDSNKRAVQLWKDTGKISPLNIPVSDAALDMSENLWVIQEDGVLQKIDLINKKSVSQHILQKEENPMFSGHKMFIDHQDKIWLFTPGNTSGLLELDEQTGARLFFCRDSGKTRLSSNIITDIIQDDKGLIWIGTDQGGVVLLDKSRMTTQFLLHSDEERSLSQNTITSMYKDNFGTVWLGTFKKGVCYFQQNMLKFPLYRRQPRSNQSLPFDDVNCFTEDKAGNIWIGTNGGGLIFFNRILNTFTRFQHLPGNSNSLNSDVVVALTVDREGKLWIGTYHGGLDCFNGKTFIHYRHNDSDPGSLSDDNVFALREEPGGDIWVGTLGGGLDRLDIQKQRFYHNNTSQPYSIHSNYISWLCYDNDLNLWIGSAFGIDVLRRSTGKYEHFTKENSHLGNDIIYGLALDYHGNMWAATKEGLSVLPVGKDSFQVFHTKDGLPSNTILGVVEDNNHFLWASTSGGLSRITVTEAGGHIGLKCINYDEYDGLQGQGFNENAVFKTREGELVFGGANGINLFSPASIVRDEHIPPVVLTGFRLFNKGVPLPPSVQSEGKLILTYNENSFSLEFAALSYINARKNKYLYQLVGFDKDWVSVDGRNRIATYTNIEPGDYTFRVKASNSDGVWNEQGITLHIIVKPPFWKTWLAYLIYFFLVLFILYAGRLQIIKRARVKFDLAAERSEARRIHEVDRMKIKFITNLSHEFGTPLSLILAPIGKLIKSAQDNEMKQHGLMVERNAKRLLHLVNQLLDIRKMEFNELKLHISPGDIAEFIKETVNSFGDLAEQKKIDFSYQTDIHQLSASFDRDKIERIVFNLLSNAFKFTPDGGSVTVKLSMVEKEEDSALLELKVRDTGIGIPLSLQTKIFESFFQGDLPGHISSQGSGIGLAITREFVEMHGGSIKVESIPDQGSCFTVLLPVNVADSKEISGLGLLASISEAGEKNNHKDNYTDSEEISHTDSEQSSFSGSEKNQIADKHSVGNAKHIKVLLVEDDDDFRFYLKDNLGHLFTLVEAVNGKEAWQKTLSAQPDIVVSDINIPFMNGLELCKKIKSDDRVSHIPVILMTGLSGEQDELQALGAGVNDFISKPFNVAILVSRIRNLLAFKGSVVQTYKRRVDIQPKEIEIEMEETDQEFIKQAVLILEANVSNADFSVEHWCRELHLSRTNLYKKIVAYTGMTPIGFIRNFRLKRAAQLLEGSRYNIAEVAYMVGFNNPKYFARYFKEEFGKIPSVYQAEKRKKV